MAGVAAALLALDMQLSWYEVHEPARFFGAAGTFGVTINGVSSTVAALLRVIELLILALIVFGRSRPSANGERAAQTQALELAWLGIVACCLVGYRILVLPGPLAPYLSRSPGIWMGLIAAAAIVIGGLLGRPELSG